MDTRIRSLVKSIVWRVTGIILLGVIAYWVTGNLKEMTIITVIFHGIRVIMYYYHERAWNRFSWGRI
ncbi:MAG: DUF2061 domain-containing protein [Candidatus Omnitrophica bacterium]|nr:DUF2061 domain-containing protein [Candidatus Omnitrophota bacterium]